MGHGGVVLHSADGGETWVRQLGGAQVATMVVEAVRAKAARQGGEAIRKELAEAERLVADGPDKPFLDVHFFDENRGLVVGAYGLAFVTDDGGKRWQPCVGPHSQSAGQAPLQHPRGAQRACSSPANRARSSARPTAGSLSPA